MMECYGLTDSGCVRANNEDYYLAAPNLGLCVVADGMGGAQAGEHASRLAVETLEAYIRSLPFVTPQSLEEAFREANRRVMNAAARDARLEGMGTTLVAALRVGQRIVIASVGDSRAYATHGQEVVAITEDQTWVNEVGRRLGIDEASLRVHPMRHVLTMAVGVSHDLRVNVYYVDPVPGTLILLCTDGLHGVVERGVIEEALLDGERSLEDRCRDLVAEARRAGGPDNITALLVRAA